MGVLLKEKLRQLHKDTLVRNSLYLVCSTAAMSLAGFVFFLIGARLFTPAQIGLATTLISAMSLLSYIGLLGFNSALIRVLPASKRRSAEINTGLTIVAAGTLLLATAYILLLPLIAPKLLFVQHTPWFVLAFIVMTAGTAVNVLTDSIFVAFRSAKFNLLVDGVLLSAIKIALPFACVALGAFGLVVASGVAVCLAAVISVALLVKYFEYKPRVMVHVQSLRDIFTYSMANYAANLLNILPTLVLPLIILHQLDAAAAGYYYLAFMVANLLYTIVFAGTQSLFAEGSYAERSLRELVKKTSLFVGVILVPAIIVVYGGAFLLLQLFGRGYAVEASQLLRILALTAPAVFVYTMAAALLRITKRQAALVGMNILYCLTIICLTVAWVSQGLAGVGYAWMIGNVIGGLSGVALLLKDVRRGALL